MRIRLTNPACWPEVRRGSEAVMHGFARWLLDRGHDAGILAAASTSGEYTIETVPYRTVGARSHTRIHRALAPKVTMIPAMARALRSIRPDIAHCYTYNDAAAARLARVPYSISYGGIIDPSSWQGRAADRRLFDWATRGAAALVCPSRAAADHLHQHYGYRAEVIPYAVSVDEFVPQVDTVPGRIFCAATPEDHRKRPDFLIGAFAVVAADVPEARLVFGGAVSPAREAELRALLPAELSARVDFVGQLDADALRREYARAAVSCLASVNEAFGMVQIESLASGTPVVGTDSGAVPEVVVSEDHGRLFAADDLQGCADGLRAMLAQVGPELSARCIARARDFDWERVGPELVTFLQSACTAP